MKRLSPRLVSLGAPLLVILALVAVQQREGRDRVQALPAALVGTGLVISSSTGAAGSVPGFWRRCAAVGSLPRETGAMTTLPNLPFLISHCCGRPSPAAIRCGCRR